MPDKNNDVEMTEEEAVMGPTDFGFIVSEKGELKSLMLPEDLQEELPEEIVLILDILGIDITAPKSERTLH